MRTTLNIDDDVLLATKELAAARKTTAGKILSELARRALEPRRDASQTRHGVPLLPRRPGEKPVSLVQVNRLRDEDEDA